MFRLLKFSDELSSLIKHARAPNDNNRLQEFMFYFAGTCSFFYYLLDNIIWLSSKKYKLLGKIKDIFSMGRCLMEIWRSLYEFARNLKQEEIILKKLGLYDECFITETEESYGLIKELIKLRRQMSFYVLELITNVLRVFMLYKSLKMPFALYMDNIFVEFCGVFSSFFALLKAIKKKSFDKKDNAIKEKRKLEKGKRVKFEEEEVKDDDFFNMNNAEMSVDDSDIGNENIASPYVGYPNGINKIKSDVSSTRHVTQSNVSNNKMKLKQVKSHANVQQEWIDKGLKPDNI